MDWVARRAKVISLNSGPAMIVMNQVLRREKGSEVTRQLEVCGEKRITVEAEAKQTKTMQSTIEQGDTGG
jgi:hypothetical protein